jgi:hypothetical protein
MQYRLAEHITVPGTKRWQQLGKTLPEFIRSQADKRKSEGDSILEIADRVGRTC